MQGGSGQLGVAQVRGGEVRPGQTEKIAKFLQQLDAMSPEELMTFRTKYRASEAAQNAVSKQ